MHVRPGLFPIRPDVTRGNWRIRKHSSRREKSARRSRFSHDREPTFIQPRYTRPLFSPVRSFFSFFFFKLFPCSWNQRKWFLALHRSPCFLFWSVSMKFYSTRCAKLLQLKLAGEKKAETLRARNEISRAFILLCFCLFFVKLYWLTQRTKA